MATYGATSFGERGQNGILAPVHGAAGVVGFRPRLYLSNGLNDGTFDLGGTTVPLVSVSISCGSAALAELRDGVGVPRTLIYAGGTVNALLTEVKSTFKVVDSTDLYFATLDLLVVTSNATVTTPSITVTIGGTAYEGTLVEASVSHGIDQGGQASCVFASAPAAATEGADFSVAMTGDGSEVAVLAGTVVGRSWEHYPLGVGVNAHDRFEYLSYPYGGTERTYTSATLGTVWQNLAEAQGIASANTSVEDPGWTVGITESLVFRRGDRFLPFIQETAQLAGYVAFSKGVDSAFYIRPLQYGVTGAGTHVLQEGVNILSARRELTRDGIINGVQVDGLTYFGASVSVFLGTANSDVRSPPGTVASNIQSNLIESSARGTIVALEFLSQHNFKPESGQITLPGTAIEPMDVLVVTHADLGMTGATVVAARVEQHFSSGGYTTSVDYKRIR